MRIWSLSTILGAFALSACSGGGTGGGVPATPAAPAAPAKSSAPATDVTLTITFPSRHAASSRARLAPQYVSPSTTGLIVAVTSGSGASASTSATGYTIGAGAANCSTTGSTTTCTVSIAAPVGSDGFAAYTYAAGQGNADGSPDSTITTPVSPDTLLSEQTGLTQTIVQNATNAVAFHLQPVIASVVASKAVLSAPGNLTPTVPLPFEALDASGNAPASYIASGSGPTNGDYRAPIALSVAESNAIVPGTATLSKTSLATTDDASSLTLEASTQQPATTSSALYSATVTATLPADSGDGFAGATFFAASSAEIEIAPLYLVVTAGGPQFTIDALAAAEPQGAHDSVADTATGGSNVCTPAIPVSVPVVDPSAVSEYSGIAPTSSSDSTNGTTEGCVYQVSDGTGTTTPTRTIYGLNGDAVVSPFLQTVMSTAEEFQGTATDPNVIEPAQTSTESFPEPVQAGDLLYCIAISGVSTYYRTEYTDIANYFTYGAENKSIAFDRDLGNAVAADSALQVMAEPYEAPYVTWCGEIPGVTGTAAEEGMGQAGTTSASEIAPSGSTSILLTYLGSQTTTPIPTSSGYIQYGAVGTPSAPYSLSVQVYGAPVAGGSTNENTFADTSSTSANDRAITAYLPLTGTSTATAHLRAQPHGSTHMPNVSESR